MATMSFSAKLYNELAKLGNLTEKIEQPDNTDAMFAEYYLWRHAETYAEKRKEIALAVLVTDGLLVDTTKLKPGIHPIGESKHFSMIAEVTEPVNRFNKDALAEAMAKRFKVSKTTARVMIEEAHLPTKSTVRKKISER